MHSEVDKLHMKRALDLARRARWRTSPNPMVGAVVVKDDRVIAEGWHRATGQPHAEIEAFNNATEPLAGATLYITLEPCCHHGRTPPCTDAIIANRIGRVVAAAGDPNPLVAGGGFSRLREAGIRTEVGLCGEEALRLNEAFFTYHLKKRPFIICKWAMTIDGKIATDSGNSQWISNEKSRNFAHQQRARVDAVMVGIGTVLIDDPMLNVRLPGFDGRQPKRIIADATLRIPVRARCLESAQPGQCIIATTENAQPEKIERLRKAGHHILVLPGRRKLLDLAELIRELHLLEIQSILSEGGSSLHGSLFQSRYVDKILAFIAPKIVGGVTAKSPISGWGISNMSMALTLTNVAFTQFDEDVCIEGYVSYSDTTAKPNPAAGNGIIEEIDSP
ncbi:MAG: bifunctional diaminohydroxyphosphoribosylaminopyrimidine deaminase/5-amino-6-(5-phosphoribosylamino)uracil reductase RibD [bacterium]